MKKLILILACLYSTASNGQTYDLDGKKFDTEEEYNAAVLKDYTKEFGAKAAKRMMNNEVWIGMTDKICLREFTDPNRRKTTYTKEGKTEIWYYQGQAAGCVGSGCPYLDYVITFKDHKAIAITTSE